MKCIVFTVMNKFRTWGSNLRVISSLLLGMTFATFFSMKYLSFSKAIDSAVQVFEPYIYICSNPQVFCAITLGNLLLMSDAPFFTSLSQQEMLRTGRKKWLYSQIIYVVLSNILYSLILMAYTALLSGMTVRTYLLGGWSDGIRLLTNQKENFAYTKWGTSFPYPEVLNICTPFRAVLETICFSSLYFSVINILILSVNLFIKDNYGWIFGSTLHFINYMISANGNFGMDVKYSLVCCALTVNHYCPELNMSTIYCFFILFVPFCLITWFCINNSKKIEPFI